MLFEVIRTQTSTLTVKADSEEEAIKKAKSAAFNHAWISDTPEYQAEELEDEDAETD